MSEAMDVDSVGPRGVKRTASEAGLPPEAPRRIKALDKDVVNKIAAGEIIVAPVNALKEMMENSIDAGSTSIEINVKDGGLKLLQITDNGHGIEKDDLPILCERFTTSKLKDFEDLMSIGTYGFRGEALASISHIAHLRVTTKTASSSCAWQAYYSDGKLIPAKPGQSPDPKPCAGRPGTQITVEDLFYNIPNRRKAFRSSSEEYAKILDVVSRYAVHRENVAFSIKKQGEAGAAFAVSSTATKLDRIRQAHGAAVAKELIEFSSNDSRWGYKASGFCSNANYSAKRSAILLFINHRAVESSAIKKAIEQTYQTFLPKGGHPFVYLSLEIDPARVDVNVHPTKREVHFLNEDEIIELVCANIRDSLSKVDTSRTFQTQTLLPTINASSINPSRVYTSNNDTTDVEGTGATRTQAATKTYEHNLVRTDSKLRKITSMLPPALTPSTSVDDANPVADSDGVQYIVTEREPIQIRLVSVKNLRAAVRDVMHDVLTETFACLTYVGLVDSTRRLAAMQSGVKLYLVDYGLVSNELFYQIGITDFGNFGAIKLQPAPQLRDLLSIAATIKKETDSDCADLDQDAMVDKIYEQLYSRRDMLNEYFSLDIDDTGKLQTIPLLLKNYIPSMAKLPIFLLRLGPFVNWSDEEECFRTFLTELASYYVPERLPTPLIRETSKLNRGQEEDGGDRILPVAKTNETPQQTNEYFDMRRSEIEHALEHVLFPAFRSRILGTTGMLKGVVEVADLKGLYRVFERC